VPLHARDTRTTMAARKTRRTPTVSTGRCWDPSGPHCADPRPPTGCP
jgi:hypothetical protein